MTLEDDLFFYGNNEDIFFSELKINSVVKEIQNYRDE
jgi:hypothetical protein